LTERLPIGRAPKYAAYSSYPRSRITDESNKGWRNLGHGEDIGLTLWGKKVVGMPAVLVDASEQVQSALRDLRIALPTSRSVLGDTPQRPAV
jgi:hypothetical protein